MCMYTLIADYSRKNHVYTFSRFDFDIYPQGFEKYSLEKLKEQPKIVKRLSIELNKVIEVSDGDNQIDDFVQFGAMELP